MDEGWVTRAGVRLHYLEWRPAEPAHEPALFLLHGLSSNARVWERVARRLPWRRVVALDMRDHGLSDRVPVGGHAAVELLQDAAHAIRELALDRPLVAGHSWGAGIALQLAAAHPELAAGLAIVDGPVASLSRTLTWEQAAERMQPPLPVYRDLQEAAAAQAVYVGEAWGEDLLEFVRAGLASAPDGGFVSTLTAPVRLEILRSFYDMQPEALFPHVRGPLLLAMAAQTWEGAPQNIIQWRRQSVEAVPALLPDTQVRWYESRHDIPLIRPAELAADLDRTAIAAAFSAVAAAATNLAAPAGREWTRRVHGDEEGWDAKDLLAHLSSTQASLPALVRMEPDGAQDGRDPFDSDRWNASQLRRRRELGPEALTQEMAAGASGLHAALMEVDVERPLAAGTFAGLTVRDGMERMLEHQQAHLEELEASLS